MRLSELITSRVVTESGEKLGHVFDVRVARDPRSNKRRDDQDFYVTGLLVGNRGMRQRFGITHSGPAGPRHVAEAVPWEAVRRIESGVVVVRDGTTVE